MVKQAGFLAENLVGIAVGLGVVVIDTRDDERHILFGTL